MFSVFTIHIRIQLIEMHQTMYRKQKQKRSLLEFCVPPTLLSTSIPGENSLFSEQLAGFYWGVYYHCVTLSADHRDNSDASERYLEIWCWCILSMPSHSFDVLHKPITVRVCLKGTSTEYTYLLYKNMNS